jgi:hypothetical protein
MNYSYTAQADNFGEVECDVVIETCDTNKENGTCCKCADRSQCVFFLEVTND